MSRFATCLIVAAFSVLVQGHPQLNPNVLNGRDALPGEFPYQVALMVVATERLTCGGALVSPSFVITAAHCVNGRVPSELNILAGAINLDIGGQTREVHDLRAHENFDSIDLHNDIALIEVVEPFVFDEFVSAVQLPPTDLEVPHGALVTAMGWGYTSYPGSTTLQLQTVDLTISENSQCNLLMGGDIQDSQVCAGGPDGTGVCFGDSGSPLVQGSTVVGLVSFGEPCAVGLPDVFTRVSSFTTWIQDHITP